MILLSQKELAMTLLMSIGLLLIDGSGMGGVNSEQEKWSLGGWNKQGNLMQDAHVVEYKAQLCVKSDKTGCLPLTINRTANIDVEGMRFFCRRYYVNNNGRRRVPSLHCSGDLWIRDNSKAPPGNKEHQVLLTEQLKNLMERTDTIDLTLVYVVVVPAFVLPVPIIAFVATLTLVFPTRLAKAYFSLGFIGLVGFSLWFWGIWKW